MSYLNRAAAGLPETVWERIDESALEAASDVLTGRRFLDLDGPYGLGLTSLEAGPETIAADGGDELATTIGSRALPVPLLQHAFSLSHRRVEGHLGLGLPLDLRAAEDAAEAVARREEQVIYNGVPELGLEGLLTASGRATSPAGDWTQVEQALDDVLNAVNQLD
ncbi:MAG: family 1 encapsulin nanocompartment shell protein, partial [Halochromatium sp.]